MSDFTPANPSYAERLRANVAQIGFTGHLGTELLRVKPGRAEIRITYRDDLRQHQGYFHGGVIGTIADNVCWYAAGGALRVEPLTVETGRAAAREAWIGEAMAR